MLTSSTVPYDPLPRVFPVGVTLDNTCCCRTLLFLNDNTGGLLRKNDMEHPNTSAGNLDKGKVLQFTAQPFCWGLSLF